MYLVHHHFCLSYRHTDTLSPPSLFFTHTHTYTVFAFVLSRRSLFFSFQCSIIVEKYRNTNNASHSFVTKSIVRKKKMSVRSAAILFLFLYFYFQYKHNVHDFSWHGSTSGLILYYILQNIAKSSITFNCIYCKGFYWNRFCDSFVISLSIRLSPLCKFVFH